jgi:hypothetical protein
MFDFNKKKISLSILLIALALISFISKIKIKGEIPIAFDDTIDKNPTEWAVMNFFEVFGCAFDYNNTFFVLMLFIIMSILLFIFSDDTQISEKVKSFKEKVLKWDIKLITISTLIFACILILGKSCSNNSKSDNSKAIQDTLTVSSQFAVDCVAVAPVVVAYPVETSYDDLIKDSISNAENKNSKGMSRFAEIKKEQAQADEGISTGTGSESGVGLSFEELKSQSTSGNNISAQLLSKYKSEGEKDK